MLKIMKLYRNVEKNWFVNFTNSRRYQFKVDEVIYYPKRELSKNDDTKSPLRMLPECNAKPRALVPSMMDYYKILGVQKTASPQEIKSAYYYLAKKYHPDASSTAHETKTFQQISEAYQVLSDENDRLEYDRYGSVRRVRRFLNTIAPGDKFNDKQHTASLNFLTDRLEENNKKSLKDNAHTTPTNEIELRLKFLQAAHGCTEYIDLRALLKCSRCNGAKRQNSQVNIEFCKKCGGTGQYRVKADAYMSHKVCEFCNGNKYVKKSSCMTCKDRGYVVQSQRVKVDVPAGSSTGDVLKITNPLTNQTANIRLNVEQSSYFQRDGNNIATNKYLTISQAVLGGKLKIRGLYEDLEVNLGPGTQSHTTHCFKGKGIIRKTSVPGDHIVTFIIRIPKNLTTKQRQLILALSRTEDPSIDGLR